MYRIEPTPIPGRFAVRHYATGETDPTPTREGTNYSRPDALTAALGAAAKMAIMLGADQTVVFAETGVTFTVSAHRLAVRMPDDGNKGTMTDDARMARDDRRIGIAYAAERFHSGHTSRGYRLLSRIGWTPRTDRAARLLPREEWGGARGWAAYYLRRARREPGLF